jgi:hypothetical protein
MMRILLIIFGLLLRPAQSTEGAPFPGKVQQKIEDRFLSDGRALVSERLGQSD